MLALTLTSMLIGFNWGLYLWAINNNHVMETSLGYFTTPLILIFCGIVFLKEKLTKLKTIAVLLTICAVSYNIIAFHGFPWISITLAISFAVYTVLRKKIPIDSQSGLLFETILLVPIAILYLVYFELHSSIHISNNSIILDLLIIGAGVLTVIPLIFLHKATLRLNLTTIVFFQYINPTLALLTAIYMYHEPFTKTQIITFSLIWIALIISIIDSVIASRSIKALKL